MWTHTTLQWSMNQKKMVRVLIWHMILKVNIIRNILTKFKDDNMATSKYTNKVIHKKNMKSNTYN